MASIWMTGATGLVGSAIRHELAAAGHLLTLITKFENVNEKGVSCIHADLSSEEQLTALSFDKADVFVHNAASLVSGQTPEEIDLLEQVNVRASDRLFHAASRAGVKKILFTSSLSVLARPLPTEITEECSVRPASPYAISKWKGEELLNSLSPDIRKIVIRISSPVGQRLSDMPNTVLRRWIEGGIRKEDIRLFGDGMRTQDFVSTLDIARAFRLAIESETATGCYHVGSGEPLSMKQVAFHIAHSLGVQVRNEGEDSLSDERWNVSIDKTRRELGYSPHVRPLDAIDQLIHSARS